jgi:general secretion pathway protein D
VELRRVTAPYKPTRIVPSMKSVAPGSEPQGQNAGFNQGGNAAASAETPAGSSAAPTSGPAAAVPGAAAPAAAGSGHAGPSTALGRPVTSGGATIAGSPGPAEQANSAGPAGSAGQPPVNPAPGATPVSVQLAAPVVAPKVGSTFQVSVNVSGGQDLFAMPMQVQYDPSKLTLINVDSGDYLGRDGQAVALVHRDDGNGGVAISASRPPGVGGVNGAGQLCVLTFQAKTAGDSIVNVTKAAARNSQQQALPVVTSGAIVHVQ